LSQSTCHSESVAGPSGIVGLDSSERNSSTGSGEESDSSITSDSVEKTDRFDDSYYGHSQSFQMLSYLGLNTTKKTGKFLLGIVLWKWKLCAEV